MRRMTSSPPAPKRRPAKSLPAFVEPMLALLVEPFESDQHFYEIKWDGFRAQLIVGAAGYRLVGRRQTDYTGRYPELSPLAKLPAGTILDGEIVQFTGGKPDFQALLARERSWSATRNGSSRSRRAAKPVTFIAFDILYDRFESVMHEPLVKRHARLAKLLAKAKGPRLVLSEGQIGDGLAFFERANELGLEGVVAKRVDGPYEPGRRTGSWSKFKRRQDVVCAVIGYLPSATGGLKSLLLATDPGDGKPRFVGKVGTGIPPADHRRLLSHFRESAQQRPAVPCTIHNARWVRPDTFCRVSFMEWTNDGKLRAPVFESLL